MSPGAHADRFVPAHTTLLQPPSLVPHLLSSHAPHSFMTPSSPQDPTYMIRAIPTTSNDRIYCKILAHNGGGAVFGGSLEAMRDEGEELRGGGGDDDVLQTQGWVLMH